MARKQSWLDALPIVLLGIRNMPNDLGFSPATAVTGTQLLLLKLIMNKEDPDLHGDDVRKIAKEMRKLDIALLSEGQLHTTQKAFIPKDLKSATYVWLRTERIRKLLEAPYSGPHRLIQKQNKYFQIETPSGEKQTVSIERLKPVKFRGANNNGNTGNKNTKRWTANDNKSGGISNTRHTRRTYCHPLRQTCSLCEAQWPYLLHIKEAITKTHLPA